MAESRHPAENQILYIYRKRLGSDENIGARQLLFFFLGFQHLVHNTVVHRSLGIHPIIALSIAFDYFQRLARVTGKDLIEICSQTQELLGLDLDVSNLPLSATPRLGQADG